MAERRMQVPFGEFFEEIAIVSGLPYETVETVLEHYNAAAARALAEGLIVEVVEGVRLQREEYFNRREAKKDVRLTVNPDYALTRARGDRPKFKKQEEEHERAVIRFRTLHPKPRE